MSLRAELSARIRGVLHIAPKRYSRVKNRLTAGGRGDEKQVFSATFGNTSLPSFPFLIEASDRFTKSPPECKARKFSRKPP
jgi:hypothetical protein